ncbi:succinate dehydrogenase assembly factor 3, mitochondrial [Copidosoma floridanum]|uniref:succinate dehydrogenase assembly factor 3, mitochondrial n=1 Tax=Copidosoma floridanum TaxID=29053 RepID=UPI0006C9A506|nr:succinate dehydrogenase assembly factor 3, mitochondrial [Copidosoma floridanum]
MSLSAPVTHLQRVRRLYKMVLKLHRGLPSDIRELGDIYVKDEFRRHKTCSPDLANVFLNEWADYAIDLSEQLGLRGVKTAKPLGKSLDAANLDKLREEQVIQLYELMMAATGKADVDEEKNAKPKETDDKNS